LMAVAAATFPSAAAKYDAETRVNATCTVPKIPI